MSRSRLLPIAMVAILAVAVGGCLAYDNVLRGDAVAPLALPSASAEGLQTDQFPTATFTITSPVDIPAAALAGAATDVTLVGELTLHG